MDNLLDSRFELVEKALATLINSISTYNPAPALANDLVAADAELSEGLQQLSTHQSNYAKIVSLRETSKALDTQIRDTLTLLTTTRRDLIATPATSFPPNANPVSYTELLKYASRISKFTIPPTYREPQAATNGDTGETGNNTPKEPNSLTQTNGTACVATNGDAHNATSTDIDSTVRGQAQPQTTEHGGVKTNLSVWEQYLNPSTEIPFFPWPSEEAIRKGALASLQILVDQGVDPATFDPQKSAELEAERKRVVEEEDALREQERMDRENARRREMERRMSASGPVPASGEEQPKVFTLDALDDDEDDD